jgi:hypothetical protein
LIAQVKPTGRVGVSEVMRHENAKVSESSRVDWNGVGYLTSIASVFFLGLVAWPNPDEPQWVLPALIVGMALSILGMAFRYWSHLQERKEIRKAKAEARRR